MQQRRGTAAQWISTNSGNGPILNAGEIGFETDTNKFKIGDGVNHWINLDYFIDANSTVNPAFGSSITFEGATANAFETTVAVTDPTADRTITLPDASGTVVLADGSGNVTVSGDLTVSGTTTTINSTTINATTGIVFEGLTANAFETTLAVADPTADRTLTLPNETGTLATQTYVDTAASNATFDAADAAGAGLDWNVATGQFDIDGSMATTSYVDTSISTHSNDTTSVHGIADTADLATKTYADNSSSGAVSTHSSDTTDVHGITNTADLATKTYADGAVTTHNADTTSVHGIADTTVLITTTDLSTHNSDTTNVHGILDTADLATKTYADGAVSTHSSDTTSVHGIADTSLLATTANISTHNSDTTDVHGIADTSVLVTSTQLALKQDKVTDVSDTEIGYLNGVTSAIQTQIDAKAPLANPTFTGTVTLPANTISQSMMSDNSVGTNEIGGLAVTEEKIAALAVTEGKIAAGAVTSAKIADGTIVNADINASAAIAQSKVADLTTDLAAKAPIASPTFTGTVTLPGAPTSDLHAATKLYVDNVTAGINFHEAVHAASVNSLAANYSNGTSGVGATLTADTNRAFNQIDGESVTVGQRVLIKNQTDAKQNGIYTLTTNGSVSTPWVLTRATDADNNPSGEMKTGDFVFVQNGTVNASIGYINNSTANPIVIGTDNISYAEFSAGKAVVAGNGLTEAIPGILSIDTSITATKASVDLKAPIDAPTFTNLVTVAASGIAFTDGTQTKEGVPSQTPIIQKTASYTLSALTERDDLIEMASASPMTLTIPLNSAVAFPVGTSIDILQTSTGQVTIAGDAGVTVNATPGLKLRTTWSSATLFKRATNTWVVFGDLTA
jgi:hypothetical protein